MAFWSSQKLKAQQQQLQDLILPYDANRVQQGAYEMCLSNEVLTTPPHTRDAPAIVDDVLMIEPGQFGLLYTAETVHIPADVIAFISIKASVKFGGLVNISGFHVDPGYHGRLKFSVYNAGTAPIPLKIGQPAFLIWFSDLDQATEDPYNVPHQHMNQVGITPQDRVRMRNPVPSPAALDQRLKKLEARWRIFVAAVKYCVLPMIVAVVAGIVVWLLTTLQSGRSGSHMGRGIRCPNHATKGPIMAPAFFSPTASPHLEQATQVPMSSTEAPTPTVGAKTSGVSPQPNVNVKHPQSPHP
jgi:dCTP deaminase